MRTDEQRRHKRAMPSRTIRTKLGFERMAFNDALLHVSSYPDPTPVAAVEQAVDFSAALGARISALTFKVEIPLASNIVADMLLDIPGMIAAARRRSVAHAQNLIGAFESMATKRGLTHQQIIVSCTTVQLPDIVTARARMHDVTMVPIGKHADLQQQVAKCVILGSGRPTIVFPETPKKQQFFSLEVVGVAWDFSRPAARAVADALPLLQRAKTVRVVTITQKRVPDTRSSGGELAEHLACHGIEAVLEEEDAAGRTIGQALEEYATAHDLDLLVMGAYGHSRLRDFILGGATKTIVANPPLPVFLSH